MAVAKIAILGGGVAGLSAAHELAERSGEGVDFEIDVYEARTDFVGGKARSTPVFTRAPKAGGDGPVGAARVAEAATEWVKDDVQALPGEHGFRFFPGFYRHLPDTMKRIPTKTGSAYDNLTVAKNLLLARFGAKDFVMPTGVPTGVGGFINAVRDLFADRHADLGLTPFQLETFAAKLWRILTSCEDRRLADLEGVTWWDFLEAGKPGLEGAYESFLAEGLSRSLLANNPRVASARTVGSTNIQLIYDVADPDRDADRLLNGPTSLAWLTPWREYLTKTRDGVKIRLHTGAHVKAITVENGAVAGARIEIDGAEQDIVADHYIAALPVECMAEVIEASPSVVAADPHLGQIPGLANSVGMMYGIQFYLTRDVTVVEGHALYVDSPWALTSISEVQFWKQDFDISKSDDGKVRGLLSVCVSEWAAKGIDGAPPAEDSPSRAALAAQVWDQLKAALNHDGEVLRDEDLHAWYLDEDVNFLPEAQRAQRGREPLFINRTNDWERRPDATTSIPNLFIASDYVRTFTDVACMEAANEAARRAVNGILTATRSNAMPCALWPLEEPAFFDAFKKADQIRFDHNLPWTGKDEPELSPYPAPTAKYVERRPNITHRQPFICNDVAMFGYFLEGDKDKLQAQIDKYLNAPTGGATDYRALSSLVLCTFADARYCASTLPPDSDEGTVREVSFTFWVAAAAYENDEPVRIAQFIPFIMVDNCWSMAAGREIYGFPKELATFIMPDDPKTADRFQASTLVFRKFSPTSQGEHLPLVEFRKEKHGGGVLNHLKRFIDRAEAGAELLHDVWGDGIGKEFMKDILSDALNKEVPAAFLKQFRDVADGRFACYQAVVETGIIASHVKDAGFLDGEWSCYIHEYDSHPLREELGLPQGDKLDCLLPFHVNMSFLAKEGREVWRAGPAPEAPPKKKVAVLGGGVGAMTAAFELTEEPDWADKYEITVYQMGWRLGGKGASGRNGALHERIEEHGLHLWFGYYHNAFDVMSRAYAANDRPAGAPLATVEEAFKPHGAVDIAEHDGDAWNVWRIDLPIIEGEFPGGEEPTLAHLLANMLKALIAVFEDQMPEALAGRSKVDDRRRPLHQGLLDKAAEFFGEHVLGLDLDERHPDTRVLAVAQHLLERHARGDSHGGFIDEMLKKFGVMMGPILGRLAEFALKAMEDVFEPWVEWALKELEDAEAAERTYGVTPWRLRRFAALLELGMVNMRGFVEDDVIEKGFSALNDYDYREWLAKHGGTSVSVDSDMIRTAYETIFAYENGDVERPNLAAGAAAYGLMRLCFGWDGSMMWKMQAGMGDTVFTPLYEVLKKRGVAFKYFHKVEALRLDRSKKRIDAIDMIEQAAIVGGGEYQPLVDVKGLPCWPAKPDFSQLVDGETYRDEGVNFESRWNQPEPHRKFALKRGEDFDEVVLGISIGGLPEVASELIAASDKWRRMIEGVPTTQTQAFQMWTTPDLPELGWPVEPGGGAHPIWDSPKTPVLGGYAQPQNTWADMSHLIPREVWETAGARPGGVAYFCGPMPGPAAVPPVADGGYPAAETEKAKATALAWVEANMARLWPKALAANGAFDWSVLMDGANAEGEARFDGQYWRANVDPTERYALTPKGGVRFRLPSGDCGFDNLVIAGDWTKNGLDIGCVEAATTSGMDAAKAVLERVTKRGSMG